MRRAHWPAYLALVAAAVSLRLLGTFESLDHRILDLQFRVLRDWYPRAVTPDVVLVGIDEQTFRAFREPLALWHPHLGQFLRAMAQAKPRLVGLDLVLPDRSYDFLKPGYDRPLLEGLLQLRQVAPVVLAQTVEADGRLRPLFAPIVSMAGAGNVGVALVRVDRDGIVRRLMPAVPSNESPLPTLVGRMAERLRLAAGAGYIDYSLGEPFAYVALEQVVDWYGAGDSAALERRFAGRIVLVGSVLPFEDRHRVPVALAHWEQANTRVPGALIHAQALRTLMHGGAIRPETAPAWTLVLLATLLYWLGRGPLPGAAGVLAFGGLAAIGSTALLYTGRWLPIAGASAVALAAFLGRTGMEALYAAAERRRLRESFGRYVSPGVLREILAGRLKPGVGGERRRVCVLFSDIRDFTGRSEREPPERILALLNRYFEEMTAAVHAHNGTVDKFIGDGLMAFFGAPNPSAAPAADAFRAARTMLDKLRNLNEALAREGIAPVQIGIGLHAGEAIIGHVGSRERHEYTAIGDTVNIAARLEGLTKEAGFPIICTQSVAGALGPAAGLAALGERPVKGHSPVTVFGWRPTAPNDTA